MTEDLNPYAGMSGRVQKTLRMLMEVARSHHDDLRAYPLLNLHADIVSAWLVWQEQVQLCALQQRQGIRPEKLLGRSIANAQQAFYALLNEGKRAIVVYRPIIPVTNLQPLTKRLTTNKKSQQPIRYGSATWLAKARYNKKLGRRARRSRRTVGETTSDDCATSQRRKRTAGSGLFSYLSLCKMRACAIANLV